jgi:FKBP-type peptidyl-prolyl cis-trans isomerase
MRRFLILIAIAALASPILFAQSRPFRRKLDPLAKPINSIRQPTKVTGEGKSTPSGVKYWDIQVGEGSPASKGHAVKVLYTAWVENGKEFASSISDGRAPIFTLGVGQVIRGWEEGVEGMKVGGKRQLRIPPDLAYGASGIPDLVPPGATLIYDVVLIELQ